ncbi:hypothetical protein BSKO_01459 [Bryopsis sp. KO-2023]|nr:hypothetical protein BSKO_01459 [Bryopsis sp. KO-2023]
MRPRAAFILIDGLGDVSVSELGGFTPLQTARTKHLDALAGGGLNGLMDPVEPGLACGSDTAHLSILGYDPRSCYRGRGAFESMGAGLEMSAGDIAFKSNFAYMNMGTGIIEKRRADRDFETPGPIFCDALNGISLPSFPDLEVRVKYATEHRCGVVIHGPGLSDCISGTDPLKDNLPLLQSKPLDNTPEAGKSAAATNELSHVLLEALKVHPLNADRKQQGLTQANVVLLRGCGSRMDLPTFEETHGMKSFVVAPTKIIAGLAMSLGMEQIVAPGGTGSYNTAFHSKAAVVCDALSHHHDFGFLHVKAVDDTGHDRNIPMKVRFLECVDEMIGQMIKRLWRVQKDTGQQFVLVCTGDHSTPVIFGDHSHEPVPFVISRLADVVAILGEAHVDGISLDPILNPDMAKPPTQHEMQAQAGQQQADRKAKVNQVVYGDPVNSFDEICASEGALGRFPGGQIMPLIKQFTQSMM